MKFKTKEELTKQIKEAWFKMLKEERAIPTATYGLVLAFESFAERVEFYKKYRDNKYQFEKDYKKQFMVYYKSQMKIIDENPDKGYSHLPLIEFNDWLFDYCFGDVKT